jgi:hypothetical protein
MPTGTAPGGADVSELGSSVRLPPLTVKPLIASAAASTTQREVPPGRGGHPSQTASRASVSASHRRADRRRRSCSSRPCCRSRTGALLHPLRLASRRVGPQTWLFLSGVVRQACAHSCGCRKFRIGVRRSLNSPGGRSHGGGRVDLLDTPAGDGVDDRGVGGAVAGLREPQFHGSSARDLQ